MKPSIADNQVTKRMVLAGELMGIELLDHIIVGSDDYYSYREEGKL
ncbi:JAB domain-containing protein [Enterococcus casseliflavus]|nr:JAB domain-containing protein [Enterococcus casseliflavus]